MVDVHPPDVFAMSWLVATLGGVLSGTISVGGAAWRAGNVAEVTTYGSARGTHLRSWRSARKSTRDRWQPHT